MVSTNGSSTALHLLYDGSASSLRRLCIVSTTSSSNGSTISLTNGLTALHRPYKRLCNGCATALRRLYDGSAIARTVAYTIVRTNVSMSSLRRLHFVSTNGSASLQRHCIVSTSSLRTALRLYDGPASSLRRLYHCLYSRPYNRLYDGSATVL
jgi:hypothetical protein